MLLPATRDVFLGRRRDGKTLGGQPEPDEVTSVVMVKVLNEVGQTVLVVDHIRQGLVETRLARQQRPRFRATGGGVS